MMKPLFETGQPAKKTAPKKKAKVKAPVVAKPKPKVEKTEAPTFTVPKAIYAVARPWSNKLAGTKDWVGNGAAIVRADVAAPSMKDDDYHETFVRKVNTTDEIAVGHIREVTDHKPVSFVKRDSLKIKHEHKKKSVTIELAVFEAVLHDNDKRLIFIDTGFIDSVEVFWCVPDDFVHDDKELDKGFVNKAANAPHLRDVTLLVAPYRIDPGTPTYRRALRKLGRKT